MKKATEEYIQYMEQKKGIAPNTKAAYVRDLKRLTDYLLEHDVTAWQDVTETTLNSYTLYLEKKTFSPATIIRNVAVVRKFFVYLFREGIIQTDVAENVRGPKLEKRGVKAIKQEQLEQIICASAGNTPKCLRDTAMVELLCSTGILIEELLGLKTSDVDMELGILQCHFGHNENAYALGEKSRKALLAYLPEARDRLLKQTQSEILFPNVRGQTMSRQGFWKIIQTYAKEVGIKEKVTPSMLRHL